MASGKRAGSGLIRPGSSTTPSKVAVPLAVSACPNPSQSSTMLTPGARTGTAAVTAPPASSSAERWM